MNTSMIIPNRPEAGDQALPLCYGDLILLSCPVKPEGTAFLCEEGCVLQDPEVEMTASSRELTFEVCVALESRALQEINHMLRKYGITPTSDKSIPHIDLQFSAVDALRFERLQRDRQSEINSNETYAKQMNGRQVHYGDLLQLKHTKRQSFLGIDVSHAPRVESSAKRIVLSTEFNPLVRFKIVPRFRYLSEGNAVCFGDNISLVSVDHPSEYLHTSPGFSSEEIGIVYEVNLSLDKSTVWCLDCFFRCSSYSETCVRTGDVLRLYHPFYDGFIAALQTGERVGFEKELPSSSMSSTMWVVEDENTITGGLLRTLRGFTLMHLVTKKYLVVSSSAIDPAILGPNRTSFSDRDREQFFSAVMLEKSRSQATSLLLQSLEDSHVNTDVFWGGRFRMAHSGTGRFLHLAEVQKLAIDNKPSKAQFRAPKRSAGRLLVASPALFRHDSFEIQKVPQDQVQAVETLSRMLPVLREYRDLLKTIFNNTEGAEFPNERVVDIIDQLVALHSFVYTGSEDSRISETMKEDSAQNPIPFCQNFMRDLGVADLLMEILRHICNLLRKQKYISTTKIDLNQIAQAISRICKIRMKALVEPVNYLEEPHNRSAVLICERIYDVLLHIARKHKQNATYIAQYLDDIQDQLVLRLGAEKLLLEILHDNDQLLLPDSEAPAARDKASPFGKRHIKFHIDALVKGGKDPAHLSFLSSMVAVGDRGIEAHQDLVLSQLEEHLDQIELKVRVLNQAVQLRDARATEGEPDGGWADVSNIATGAGRSGVRGAALKRVLDYWQEYLLLLATLCKPGVGGRRDFLVRKVQALVQFDICATCFADDSLPMHLRWTVCELLRVAFVEQDEFLKVSRAAGVAVWNDLDQVADAAHFSSGLGKGSGDGLWDNQHPTSPRSHAFTAAESVQLKKAVMEYFAKNTVHYYPARAQHANRFKTSVLRLCRQLLLFGHFHFAELEAVMRIAHNILDFSNLRFEDVEQKQHKATLEAEMSEAAHHSTVSSVKSGDEAADDMKTQVVLSEQTVSAALRRLRALVGEFPSLEAPRLQCIFVARVYEVGEVILEQGAPQDGMYVIQAGSAFAVKTDEGNGAESIAGTVGPGQVLGAEALTHQRLVWPWRVRCSARLTALFVPREAYNAAVRRLGSFQTRITDGLINIFHMQREACLIINDVYDLRLQVRSRMLLQEYRFDYNISTHRYCARDLAAANTLSPLSRFPMRPEAQDDNAPTHFVVGGVLVFGPLSSYIVPQRRGFFGLLRIDRAILVIAGLQAAVAIVIIGTLAACLATDGARSAAHPGRCRPVGAAAFNVAVTVLWGLANVCAIWSAATLNEVGIIACTTIQLIYHAYFVANTAAGLSQASSATRGVFPAEYLQSQAVWFVLGITLGAYNSLAFASLAVLIGSRGLFETEQNTSVNSDNNDGAVQHAQPAPHKFLKALEFFDLDKDGSFSRTLTDLFVSRYRPLVVDAYCLLIRTHDSAHELYRSLSSTLLLADDNGPALHGRAVHLTEALLNAANSLQAKGYASAGSAGGPAEASRASMMEVLEMVEGPDLATAVQRRLFQRLGLHRVILRLLLCIPPDRVHDEGELCYALLSVLCVGVDRTGSDTDSVRVQRDAAEAMGTFLRHLDSSPRTVASFLTRLYAGNPDLCETADDALVERVIALMRLNLDPAYFALLRTLVAPYGINVGRGLAAQGENSGSSGSVGREGWEPPLRRNQNLVMKHLGGDGALFLSLKQQVRGCRAGQGGVRVKANRAVYIAMLELLAACMAGRNAETQRRCRGGNQHLSLTLGEIEEQLKDRALSGSVHCALLRYLEEAYIRVDPVLARQHASRQEMLNIFDGYSRRIDMLPSDSNGSKVPMLTHSTRLLLLDRYLECLTASLAALLPADFANPAGAVTRTAVHLLEGFAGLLLVGLAPDAKRAQCSKEDEVRVLHVVRTLVDRLEPHGHTRYCKLRPTLARLLYPDESHPTAASSDFNTAEDDEQQAIRLPTTATEDSREMKLIKELASESEKRRNEPLDVSTGLKAFADDFFKRLGGDSGIDSRFGGRGVSASAVTTSGKLLDSLRELRPETASEGTASDGLQSLGVAGAGSLPSGRVAPATVEPPPFSDLCMDSLVDLMEAAVTSPKFLPPGLCQQGLAILLRVVQSVPRPTSSTTGAGQQDDDDEEDNHIVSGGRRRRGRWFVHGIPGVVIACVTAPGAPDSAVAECLAIGIVMLERGKRRAQMAFHRLLSSCEGGAGPGRSRAPAFFAALRDRLVRAERGGAAFQALFWSRAAELNVECTATRRELTIAGVIDACNADRGSRSIAGSHPSRVLRLLQLFCEGHNRQMQDFIRDQGPNSVDLVAYTSHFVVSVSRQLHPAAARLIVQGLDTLTEFVQNPCPANQRTLVDSQLPHALNRMLLAGAEADGGRLQAQTADRSEGRSGDDFGEGAIQFQDAAEFQRQAEDVKTKAVTLLLSLLERVEGPFIPTRILEALELDAIVHTINNLRNEYLPLCRNEGTNDSDEDEDMHRVARLELAESGPFRVACSLYILLEILRHYDVDGRHRLANRMNGLTDSGRLRANCGFVEVARDGRLERVFFQVPSVCRFLTEEAREGILRASAGADNHQDKMLEFVRKAQAQYDELVHLQSLEDWTLYRAYAIAAGPLSKLFFLNALAINAVMVGGYRYSDPSWLTLESPSNIVLPQGWFAAVLSLAMLQLVICAARLAGYYLDQGVLEVRRRFYEDEYVTVYTELKGGPQYYYLFLRFLLSDGQFLILVTFLIANLLAVALCGWTPLSFLLLGVQLADMFQRSTALADVLRAVGTRSNTLLQTGGLALILMYMYAVVGFIVLPERFQFDSPPVVGGDTSPFNPNGAACNSIWKCFLVTVDMGMRKGDIGEALNSVQWRDLMPGVTNPECDGLPGLETLGCTGFSPADNGSLIYFRIFYTSTFFIFVDTILTNIIFGVIIDTFGDLRRQHERAQEELENTCFICGVQRYVFEAASVDGRGFSRHQEEEHNMWTYLYLVIYLYLKDPDDHTGFDSYIFSKINESDEWTRQLDEEGQVRFKRSPDVNWLPNGDALAIQGTDVTNNEAKLVQQVDRLCRDATAIADETVARLQTAAFAADRARAARQPSGPPGGSDSEYTRTSDSEAGGGPEDGPSRPSEGPATASDAALFGPMSMFSVRGGALPLAAAAQLVGASPLGMSDLASAAVNVQEGVREAVQIVTEIASDLAGVVVGAGGGDGDDDEDEYEYGGDRDYFTSLSGAAGAGAIVPDTPGSAGLRFVDEYQQSLEKLIREGFDNDEWNREVLRRHRGNFEAALRDLNAAGAPMGSPPTTL